MAINTRPPRTLADIKTHSGRTSTNHEVYRDYFQVGALELERWRRTKEREAALSRIASIDNRIADIDKEKTALLARAAEVVDSVIDTDSKPKQLTEKRKSSGLRIKY